MTTLFTTMTDNVGQMPEAIADKEIKRLNSEDGRVWRKDYSDQMYVEDETERNVSNPTKRLSEYNYVFVTCTPNGKYKN